jgi:hypothetical protein
MYFNGFSGVVAQIGKVRAPSIAANVQQDFKLSCYAKTGALFTKPLTTKSKIYLNNLPLKMGTMNSPPTPTPESSSSSSPVSKERFFLLPKRAAS